MIKLINSEGNKALIEDRDLNEWIARGYHSQEPDLSEWIQPIIDIDTVKWVEIYDEVKEVKPKAKAKTKSKVKRKTKAKSNKALVKKKGDK